MKFTKMHGISNDYIYVNGAAEKVEDKKAAAIALSDRHTGIGSDGIIFINPSDRADFEMEMYNSDGSRAEMCGNGIRCVAKYVYDKGLTKKRRIDIDTLAGVKTLDLEVDEATDTVTSVRVNMGAPIIKPGDIPCIPSFFEGCDGDSVIGLPLEVEGKKYSVSCISVGNPHVIVPWDTDLESLDIEKTGPSFENHPAFPNRINTEFIRVIDRNTVAMRVWERGAGETMACGTGATAVAVACILGGLTENRVTVKLLGGNLTIEWDGNTDSPVFMTGGATTVFEGEV